MEALAFDVTDLNATSAAIGSVVANYQRLDILIANAGTIHRAQLADWTPKAWDAVLNTNLKACFFLAQQAAVPMRGQKHGRIHIHIVPCWDSWEEARFTPMPRQRADLPAWRVLSPRNLASTELLAIPLHPDGSRPISRRPS